MADVLVAGHLPTGDKARRDEHLDAVADREDPQVQRREPSNDRDEPGVVPEILGGPTAEDEHRRVVLRDHLVEGQV